MQPHMLREIYLFFVGNPALLFYVHAPSFSFGPASVGFNGGRSMSAICADLTGMSAAFWEVGNDCRELLQSRVDSVMVSAAILAYFILILNVLTTLPNLALRSLLASPANGAVATS